MDENAEATAYVEQYRKRVRCIAASFLFGQLLMWSGLNGFWIDFHGGLAPLMAVVGAFLAFVAWVIAGKEFVDTGFNPHYRDDLQKPKSRLMRVRYVVSSVVATTGAGILVFFELSEFREYLDKSTLTAITLVAVSTMIVGTMMAAMVYLQSEGGRNRSNNRARQASARMFQVEGISYVNAAEQSGIDGISAELEELRAKLAVLESGVVGGNEEQFNSLSKQLANRVLNAGGEELLNRAEGLLRIEIERLQWFRIVNDTFEESKERLFTEISRLDKKSSFNLTVGGISTLIGVAVLGYTAMSGIDDYTTLEVFLYNFAPRLSVVLLLQVFSFFFLKLYKNNLEEIKYFQNEITNVENRQITINVAMERGKDEDWKELLMALLRIDRNKILEKGQTTIDIEHARIENSASIAELLARLAPYLNLKK